MGFYSKSLLYKPKEKYPQDKIDEIEKLLVQNKELKEQYESTDESDNLFAIKNEKNNIKDTNNTVVAVTKTDNKNIKPEKPDNKNIKPVKFNDAVIISDINKSKTIPGNMLPDSLTNTVNGKNIDELNIQVKNLIKSANKEELAKTYYTLASQYYNSGEYDKSLDNYELAYKTNDNLGLKKVNAGLADEMGTVYENLFRYTKAEELYNKSLLFYNESGDNKNAAILLQKLGDVNYASGNYIKAIDYYKKSLNEEKQLGITAYVSDKYNSIGVAYYQMGNYNEAIKNFQQSIKIAKEIGNNKECAMTLNNIGNINYEYNKYDNAIDYYTQSVTLKKQIDYKKGIAVSLHNLGNVYKKLSQYEKSLGYYRQSNEMAIETADKELISENYLSFSEVYSNLKNCSKSMDYYKLYATNKHLITRDASHEQFVETSWTGNESVETNKELIFLKTEMRRQQIFAKYESEKNTKEITLLNQENKIHRMELLKKEQKVRNQRIVIISSLISLIIVIFFASMFYRQYREKKQANIRLAEQNEEINTQNEEIMTQRDEISTQRDSVTKQKEHIEKIHHELTDSINYAQRIQEAMLPKELTDLFPEHFVIFLPKDIVSGDFYWTTMITNEHTSLRIVAVADCTGHGVPGAFMSMLGISGLKEIVINKKIIRPDLILNHLRDYIIDSLQQRSLAGEINTNIIQDGMDMTICAIDLDKMEMEFAGAYNPIYYIHNNQLTEYKSDKMPIGYFVIMNPYNLQKIKIQKDDIVYLMSDGFKDQFGGEFRKKLKAKTLKKMLTNFSNLNMDSQKKNIIEALNNWKSINEQVDDITLIGIKI